MQIRNSARRLILWIVVLLVGAFGYKTLKGPQGIPALRDRWNEIRTMEEQNAALQRENEYRRDRIKKLEKNSAEQELEIRRKLKLLRPGETSFILPEPHPTGSASEPGHDGSAAPAPNPAPH